MDIQPGHFCWIELHTPNEAEAKRFYTSLFGWSLKEIPIPDGSNYVMLQKDGKTAAAMYENKQGHPAWASYVAVANVDESTEKAKSLGANVMMGPFDVMEAGRMSVVADPTGAAFAMWQGKATPGLEVYGEENALCWNELATRDTAAAETFYTSLFGWRAKHDKGAEMEYIELHKDDRGIGGMYAMFPGMENVPPHWLPYFAVNDCDAMAEKAKSLGGSLMMPPKDIPKVGRFAIVMDPHHAAFAIIQLKMEQR